MMENIYKIGEAGKTLGTHYVEAMEMLENNKSQEVTDVPKTNENGKVKWYEVEGALNGLKVGDHFEVVNRDFLLGRRGVIVAPSGKEGFVKGYLLNKKGTAYGKTLGTYRLTQIQKIELSENIG
jgi:hypothetical protein